MLGQEALKLRPRTRLYIALDDLDLSFTQSEVDKARFWWRAGLSLGDMAQRLDRDCDEVAILLMDLARRGRIEARPGGVYGA